MCLLFLKINAYIAHVGKIPATRRKKTLFYLFDIMAANAIVRSITTVSVDIVLAIFTQRIKMKNWSIMIKNLIKSSRPILTGYKNVHSFEPRVLKMHSTTFEQSASVVNKSSY